MTTSAPATSASTAPSPTSSLPGLFSRRWPTWLGLASTGLALGLVELLPYGAHVGITAWSVLLAAVIYLTWGAARDELRDAGWRRLETAGVLGFSALAIVAVAAAPGVARYVLAAGWLAHAAWDVVHHRQDRVVPRWYAETCMVSDLVVATALLAGAVI